MPLLKLLRSTSFQLALIYLAIFAASAVALLTFVYVSTAGYMADQTDETIEAEMTGLIEQYRRRGLPGLRQIVLERSSRSQLSLYLLANGDRSRIAGNLSAWPVASAAPGWVEFEFEREGPNGPELRPARARRLVLQGGFLLLVGRDVFERKAVEARVETAILWSAGLTLALGLSGGLFLSRRLLARLDAINRTSRVIMGGDLARRVPVTGNGDEFDDLAQNLNQMLDQIERLMAGMREVADNIAHDLRTPLNRLRARLELATMAPGATEEDRAALEDAIAQADGLIQTFNALLLIAEAETGAARETLEELDLAETARGVAELYEPLAESCGQTLMLDIAGNSRIRGNRALISQALANLLDNAVKYGREGGSIRLSVAAAPGTVTLSVADDGPGVPEADRVRVLDRFVRLEESRSRPGSGLGLALVAAVARLHEATLSLEDAAPGLKVVLRFRRV